MKNYTLYLNKSFHQKISLIFTVFQIYFIWYLAYKYELFYNRKGKSQYVKSSIKSYCSDKLGFIYPVKIFLDHSFGHFDDFCLLASILKVTSSNDYIVFDNTGKIVGISE